MRANVRTIGTEGLDFSIFFFVNFYLLIVDGKQDVQNAPDGQVDRKVHFIRLTGLMKKIRHCQCSWYSDIFINLG